ncbi:PRC-barrel domain-containing protein [Candidatus Pacearchaeota archaeon]|nr:PRC-barrel domain-containing protein [Candidatus Pacearchaeota archaeon]
MEEVFDKTTSFDETINIRKIIGVRVISENGHTIGRVTQARINPNTKSFEGVVVRKGLFRKIYIGKNYFETLSPEGVILVIEPSILLKGEKVIAYDGEVIGKVKSIDRVGKTNTIKSITVHSFLRGSFSISVDYIKSIAKNILLKENYNAPKKSLWRRAR